MLKGLCELISHTAAAAAAQIHTTAAALGCISQGQLLPQLLQHLLALRSMHVQGFCDTRRPGLWCSRSPMKQQQLVGW